jgi:hypothetical protein
LQAVDCEHVYDGINDVGFAELAECGNLLPRISMFEAFASGEALLLHREGAVLILCTLRFIFQQVGFGFLAPGHTTGGDNQMLMVVIVVGS